MKIKNKITLLFTVLVTAILLVFNISIYFITSRENDELFEKRLKNRASNNAQLFNYLGDTSLAMLRRIDGGSLAMLPKKSVTIMDTLGNSLYEFRGDDADSLGIDPILIREVFASGEKYFKIGKRDVVGLRFENNDRSFIIFVAGDNEDGRQRLSQLKQVLFFSLLIGMLVTIVTGYVFSSQLVKPISAINREVNAISSHNLSKRLSAGISQDELNQLARTFNDLLDRLQESFTTQRRFISNASHELSTPLTSILSQLQVTFQKERTIAEYQRVLQSVHEDVEQMRQLTRSLLEIAKTGTQGTIELNDLRIDELLLKVIADIVRGNPTYDVEMAFPNLPEDENQCRVFGNFDLLYSALKNIIENGCKFSPDKKSVVEVSFTDFLIMVNVRNTGDVITEQEIDQIFQPFFRGGNVMDVKGFGLGLPLARRIITLHKGEIKVISHDSETIFSIILPSLIHKPSQF